MLDYWRCLIHNLSEGSNTPATLAGSKSSETRMRGNVAFQGKIKYVRDAVIYTMECYDDHYRHVSSSRETMGDI